MAKTKILFIDFSIKKDMDKIKSDNSVFKNILQEAKQIIEEKNKNYKILHIIISKYILDGIEFDNMPENIIIEEAILELMKQIDEYIPQPERPVDQPFLMPIEDVFSISGRGTVVTGRVERGVINVNEEIEIVGVKETQTTTCTGVEMFRKLLDQGEAGDNVGVLLRGIDRDQVERGQVLCKPKSITPHTKFKASAYILTKEEGGRHTPFFTNYRPQFYFRTTDVTGVVTLPSGTEMVMPGDNIEVDVELIVPIAMEENLRFAIREGGRTVGAGVVSAIVE